MPTITLPDFADMINIANGIADLLRDKLWLENEISFDEAQVTVEASGKILVNGKPPSMEYIKNSYLVTGFDGKLKEKRNKLADVQAELERKRLILQIYRDMLDIYRTESANERAASIA